MSTIKTTVNDGEVLNFLKKNFSENIDSIETISGGEISQGFYFSSSGRDYVIRVNKSTNGFEKDRYAYENFHSEKIPIPKTIDIGKLDNNLHYSITERAPGKIIDDFSKSEIRSFMSSIIDTLDSIHKIPIKDANFGAWDGEGKARSSSWNEHLLKLVDTNNFDIKKGKHGDFLEQEVIERFTKEFVSLLKYCPEVKHLVHADFGFNNTLSNGKKITGVIDWDNSMYGDFLYDIAWLSFWEREIDYKEIFRKHYLKNNVAIDNFDERIMCYMLHFGIGALFFFAKSEQKESYLKAKERLLEVIK